jgi:hypothetical protein
VHGENQFIGPECTGSAHADGLLADTTEPFGYTSLPEQIEHFFLNEAWFGKLIVQVEQGFVGETFFGIFYWHGQSFLKFAAKFRKICESHVK